MEKLYVPSEILRVFRQLFPKVDLSEVEWDWEYYNKIYEAEFEHEGRDYEVEITVTGHHLLTEVEIEKEDLPEVVTESVEEHFPGFTIEEAEHITFSNGDVYYELALENEEEVVLEVHLREDGLVVATGEDL
jgi:hypothetical protein